MLSKERAGTLFLYSSSSFSTAGVFRSESYRSAMRIGSEQATRWAAVLCLAYCKAIEKIRSKVLNLVGRKYVNW